jgi:pteridine reductase
MDFRVLITGGAVRVGAALAHAFSAEGCQVVIHYNASRGPALALASVLGAKTFQADLSTPQGPRSLADLVGPVDVLVNSAAAYEAVPFEEITSERWDAMQALNVRAPALLTQALLPGLRASELPGGGCVLNLGDIAGDRPVPGFAHYCVSKAALHHLTRALALELAPAVRVNAIAPGTVLPPIDLASRDLDRLRDTIPAGRFGNADDVAGLAVHLALRSPYVTGQIWAVDGGRSLGGPMEAG